MNNIARFFDIAHSVRIIQHEVLKAEHHEHTLDEAGKVINAELSRLGPAFIKLGQMLSLRPDIIPIAYANQLRHLLDHGPLISTDAVRRVFQEEFGKRPEDLFDSFNTTPVAVASLAQVYAATRNGKHLAVKVQKPDVLTVVQRDLRLMRRLIFVLSWTKTGKKIRHMAEAMISEFFSWIERELDYRLEALNMSRIKKNFEHTPYLEIPAVVHEISSKRILTMEYVDGVSLNEIFDALPNIAQEDIIEYKTIKVHKAVVFDHLIKIVYKQVFEDGFFHADPHPANIFVTQKGHLAMVDFGITGILHPRVKHSLVKVFRSLAERDVPEIANTMISLDEVAGHQDLPIIEERIRKLLDNWQSGSVTEMSMAEVLLNFILIGIDSGIDLPLSMIILGKTIMEYDGVVHKLNPDADLIDACRPLLAKNKELRALSKDFVPSTIQELLENLHNIPEELHSLIRKLSGDGVNISVQFGPLAKAQTTAYTQTVHTK